MGLYDEIKDVAKVIQKVDNIDLYKQLLDLSSQALELQNEVAKLQQENANLTKRLEIEDDIERSEKLFITRKSDSTKIKYCSHCWDSERKLIQIDCHDSGQFDCPHCKSNSVYDKEKYSSYISRRGPKIRVIGI